MIFHVSCPLTCQKICFCDLGFNNGLKSKKARENFSIEVEALEAFLKNTWTVKIGEETGTVQVPVPRVVQRQSIEDDVVAALQRQAVEAKAAKEDYIRRLETGDVDLVSVELLEEAHSPYGKEELGSSNVKVICRICLSGENEGSTKALKMLSCKTCDKKYHRSCIKSWAENRDLFHWSSWDCPSCRTCEVCKSAGDPSKLMFCRRCDDAYHCYCQTPPHKNVGHGTYVCAKHTRCHSCGSTVPGNGPSTRWFLGYTCCDACGRLFVKGNYCPVCLKVYRDSEMTPMVCCDICERWIHCSCDGISDEKYQQFQSDQNLQYTCAACRGDCYQVRDTDDAVRELWRRKDEYDRKLIATLRANAGLPSQGDISPYFDDDHQSYSIRSKHDYGRPLKFSVKGSSDTYTSTKELGNPVSKNALQAIKKKINSLSAEGAHQNYEKHTNVRESQQLDHDSNFRTKVQDEGKKKQDLHIKEPTAKDARKNENVKGTKLVIHIGSKTKNTSSSPKSETSSYHKEQDLVVHHGNEDVSHLKMTDTNNHTDETGRNGKGTKVDYTSTRRSSKHGYKEDTGTPVIISSKQRKNNSIYTASPVNHENDDDIMLTKKKQTTGSSAVNLQTDTVPYTSRLKFVSSASPSVATNDPKPLLKLKFKNPYFEQKSSWAPKGEEESIVKGQRSKRKRPTIIVKNSSDKNEGKNDSATMHQSQNLLTDQEMEANWILQKLGKDAIGKRVEVHQPPDGSWRKGTVTDVTIEEGDTSSLSLFVIYDDGKTTTLDLKKQAVRFASQKHYKRSKLRH